MTKPKHKQIGAFIGGRWWRHPGLLRLPYDMWRELKAFIHRGRYGWAPCDTWSLDRYLEEVLEDSLRHLAANTHGYPGDTTPKEWEAHLKDVADRISYNHYCEDRLLFDEPDKDRKERWKIEEEAHDEMIKALHRLVDRWGHLWD